jgi:hypothetical protein
MKKSLILFFVILISSVTLKAITSSGASSNWASTTTWVGGVVPTLSDDVVIAAGHSVAVISTANCKSLSISATGTLNIAATGLNVYGGITNDGSLIGNSTLWMKSGTLATATFSSSTSITTSTLILRITSSSSRLKVIAAGTVFTSLSQLIMDGAGSLTNNGTMTIVNAFTISGSTFINGATGIVTCRKNITLVSGGLLDCSTSGNSFKYSGTGFSTIASSTYYDLTVDNGSGSTVATKNLGGAITISNSATLASNVQLNCANFSVNVNGTWTNDNPTNDMTNIGTFTFGGANPTMLRKTNGIVLGNVIVNCTGSFTPNSSNTATYTGNLTCQDLTLTGGTFDLNAVGNYTVNIQGNLSIGAGLLNERSGTLNFNGTAAQTISGTTTTFTTFTVANAAGVSTTSAMKLSGTLTVSSGTFTSNVADFTLLSDATTGITARVATLGGTGALAGSRWVIERAVLNTGSSNTNAYWGDYSSPTTSSTLSDWDSEMWLSGCGGADGNSCCPIFRSVKQWNNAGATYSNVTSLITLVPGIGYSIWTASTLTTYTGMQNGTKIFNSKGTPNSGTITKNTTGAAYYLFGNPYPSQILWSSLTRTNIGDYFFVLDEVTKNYDTWDGSTGTGTGKLSGTGGVINSSQGFLVEALGAGSLSFTEASKSASNVTFVKMASPQNMVKFHFNGIDGKVGSENVIHFVSGASNEKDALDIGFLRAPYDETFDVKTLSSNGYQLCKNTLNLNDESHEIPMVFKPAVGGKYTLTFDNLAGLEDYTCVYLEDINDNKFFDLKSNAVYEFAQSDNAEHKFVIHFRKSSAQDDACVKKSNAFETAMANAPIANVYMNEFGLVMNVYQKQKVNITIFNTSGQVVSSVDAYFVDGQSVLEAPTAPGVYLVKLSTGEKSEVHKILVD